MGQLCRDLEETSKELEETKNKIDLYNRILGNLNSKMGTLEELTAKTEVYKTILNNAKSYREDLERETTKLSKLNDYLKIDYSNKIEKIINIDILNSSLNKLREEIRNIDSKLEVMNKYEEVKKEDIDRVINMNLLISKFKMMKNSYNNIELEFEANKKDLDSVKEALGQFKICPLCNRPLE